MEKNIAQTVVKCEITTGELKYKHKIFFECQECTRRYKSKEFLLFNF